jgi:hypothetical protein
VLLLIRSGWPFEKTPQTTGGDSTCTEHLPVSRIGMHGNVMCTVHSAAGQATGGAVHPTVDAVLQGRQEDMGTGETPGTERPIGKESRPWTTPNSFGVVSASISWPVPLRAAVGAVLGVASALPSSVGRQGVPLREPTPVPLPVQ